MFVYRKRLESFRIQLDRVLKLKGAPNPNIGTAVLTIVEHFLAAQVDVSKRDLGLFEWLDADAFLELTDTMPMEICPLIIFLAALMYGPEWNNMPYHQISLASRAFLIVTT
ncbi:hypothetical protein C8J56DRAFT_1040912 [Mycena floridula]|nr:hypothetical protein C8J56DRAFT_1040912 [Mycena floridula]